MSLNENQRSTMRLWAQALASAPHLEPLAIIYAVPKTGEVTLGPNFATFTRMQANGRAKATGPLPADVQNAIGTIIMYLSGESR